MKRYLAVALGVLLLAAPGAFAQIRTGNIYGTVADAQGEAVQQRCERATEQAFEAGVFGAPSWVIDGELFWGQDRLDFVERRLAARP